MPVASRPFQKFSPADRDQLIHKYHPDYRASAYRPIRFGPNKGDQTVIELATLLEGDSPIQDDLDLSPAYHDRRASDRGRRRRVRGSLACPRRGLEGDAGHEATARRFQ